MKKLANSHAFPRYTKNLSPEQISLSALRGSGELADLTLDEDLLTELLELPGWLRLTSATCNRASFRIQWTKLKTVPIILNLDEVRVALEVCMEPRAPAAAPGASSLPAAGKYSYIHKVIDGISVAVNQVQVDFKCDAFTSSVQISRVTVESRTPQWQKGDLRLTRVKSPDTGQLLIFKEVEWQTARVEARAHGAAAVALPPLRLLCGAAHTRIVIKKRLSDCSVMGSRLVVQPEPVAWALTDGQLRAALACAAALAEPVKKATAAATRAKALRKIQTNTTQEDATASRGAVSGERDTLARLFARYDVRETSYHLLAPRIDLHLCDDPGLGRSDKPSLEKGGALQVTLLSMQADFFPYHKASDDRRHWRGYRETATPHSQWLSQALSTFCGTLLEVWDPRPVAAVAPSHKGGVPSCESVREEPLSNGTGHQHTSEQHNNNKQPAAESNTSTVRTRLLNQLGKLMTTCLVLRIDDFTVYKVSTGSRSREPIRPLVSGEKATLPGDAGLLHAEFTHFYYPGDVCFPVPAPKLYVQLSPVRACVDVESVVWLAAFLPHVGQALAHASAAAAPDAAYTDVKVEAIMPKVVLEACTEHVAQQRDQLRELQLCTSRVSLTNVVLEAGAEHVAQQRDRPRELQLCAARVSLTNVREPATAGAGSRADLAATLAAMRRAAPAGSHFPAAGDDLDPIHQQFILHADNLDDVERGKSLKPELLWRECRAVWCARVEPCWADFCGARATNYKPAPLLDAVPITAWLCAEEGLSRVWAVCRATGLASVQLNHYQLLFLLRQLERISELAAWLAHDADRQPAHDSYIVVGVVVPAVEVTLVLPASCTGQESCRDLDSVPLDSSSLQELKLAGSESTVAACGAAESPPEPPALCAPSAPPANDYDQLSSLTSMHLGTSFTGFSSMRRGFNSLVTSIDSALTREDSRSDAASTASSDSERYVVVGLADSPDDVDNAFREFETGRSVAGGVGGGVEVAAEVTERSSSPSERSVTSSCPRRDTVSTCTWRVSGVQLVQEAVGARSRLRLVADDVAVDECSAIPWDEFQSKFSMRARAYPGAAAGERAPGDEFAERAAHKLAARLTRTTLPRKHDDPKALAECEELLEARVRGVEVAINMSTALALAEFAEDEVLAPPMPLEVSVEETRVTLKEDRGARCISSPPPQPLHLALRSLSLKRDAAGLLTLGAPAQAYSASPPPCDCTASADSQRCAELEEGVSRLRRENEELRRRLATLARVADDNRDLRAKAEEALALRECAHAAQQETASLLADKNNLLDTVRALQEQLSATCLGRGKR